MGSGAPDGGALHLRNLGLVDQAAHDDLRGTPPRAADYVEREVRIPDDLRPPMVPPRYAAAVVKAYRTQRLSAERAIELVFGTLGVEDLPRLDSVPLEALRSEPKRIR